MTARRELLLVGLAGLAGLRPGTARADAAVVERLRRGGVVAAFRHANAPGTYDPPGFRLGECGTQRNLDELGREQARRLGAWFRDQRLVPAAVRSSPWCRCLDTARLAFGQAEAWAPLGSPRASTDEAGQLAALRAALARVEPGRFEVWVSHQFTLSALAGGSTASGEGLVLGPRADGSVELLARLPPP